MFKKIILLSMFPAVFVSGAGHSAPWGTSCNLLLEAPLERAFAIAAIDHVGPIHSDSYLKHFADHPPLAKYQYPSSDWFSDLVSQELRQRVAPLPIRQLIGGERTQAAFISIHQSDELVPATVLEMTSSRFQNIPKMAVLFGYESSQNVELIQSWADLIQVAAFPNIVANLNTDEIHFAGGYADLCLLGGIQVLVNRMIDKHHPPLVKIIWHSRLVYTRHSFRGPSGPFNGLSCFIDPVSSPKTWAPLPPAREQDSSHRAGARFDLYFERQDTLIAVRFLK